MMAEKRGAPSSAASSGGSGGGGGGGGGGNGGGGGGGGGGSRGADSTKRARLEAPAKAPAPAERAAPENDGGDEVARALGFASFGSTKGKHVPDNDATAARGAKAHSHARKVQQVINTKKKQKRWGPAGPPGAPPFA